MKKSVLLLVFTLAFELFFLVVLQNIVDIIYYNRQTEIFNTISFNALLVIDVIFPLVVAMFKFVYWIYKPVQKSEMIDALLSTDVGYEIFLNFAKREFAVENVLAWKDIHEYKTKFNQLTEKMEDGNADLATLYATAIYRNYFAGQDSLYETNVRMGLCKEIHEAISSKKVAGQLFDGVLYDLRENLSDTFFRLQSSPEYRLYMASKALKADLLDKKIERETIIGQHIESQRKTRGRGSISRNAVHKSINLGKTEAEVSRDPPTIQPGEGLVAKLKNLVKGESQLEDGEEHRDQIMDLKETAIAEVQEDGVVELNDLEEDQGVSVMVEKGQEDSTGEGIPSQESFQ
jgi:hypothetical protein